MSKQVLFELDALKRIKRGVDTLSKSVSVTFGPKGRNVAIDKPMGPPLVTKDGVQVARQIDLVEPYENMGAQIVKKAATETASNAGDGTTTSTIIAAELFDGAVRYLSSDVPGVHLRRGMNSAVGQGVHWLRSNAYAVQTSERVKQVATISSNGDEQLGEIISTAAETVGKDGIITVDQGKGVETELEFVEGLQYDKGLVTEDFLPEGESRIEWEDPLVLCIHSRVPHVQWLLPALEYAHEQSRPLVVVAQDVEDEALSAMVRNHMDGVVDCAAIRAPRIGDKRREHVEDVAVLCDGMVVDPGTGVEFGPYGPEEILGTCRTFKAGMDRTEFLEGAADETAIRKRISELRTRAQSVGSEHDREFLQQRISQLSGGVAIIRIGAETETEMKNRRALVEDALSATQAAIRGGVCPGGGFTLIRMADHLEDVRDEFDFEHEAQEWGWKLVESALREPTKQLLSNAGLDPSVIVAEASEYTASDVGYDLREMEFVDLYEEGIIDPTVVIEEAVVNAASAVGSLVMSSAAVGPVDQDAEEDENNEEDFDE